MMTEFSFLGGTKPLVRAWFHPLAIFEKCEIFLTAEHEIHGEESDPDLTPYIHLNLANSAPWSLNPPLIPKPNPNPTHLHPLDRDPTPPHGSHVLHWGATGKSGQSPDEGGRAPETVSLLARAWLVGACYITGHHNFQ